VLQELPSELLTTPDEASRVSVGTQTPIYTFRVMKQVSDARLQVGPKKYGLEMPEIRQSKITAFVSEFKLLAGWVWVIHRTRIFRK
jgi:hypothetical protein